MTTFRVIERIHDETNALRDRVDVLFPPDAHDSDRGFGRGFREILDHADDDASHFAWQAANEMIAVVTELVTLMEHADREHAEADRIHREWEAAR